MPKRTLTMTVAVLIGSVSAALAQPPECFTGRRRARDAATARSPADAALFRRAAIDAYEQSLQNPACKPVESYLRWELAVVHEALAKEYRHSAHHCAAARQYEVLATAGLPNNPDEGRSAHLAIAQRHMCRTGGMLEDNNPRGCIFEHQRFISEHEASDIPDLSEAVAYAKTELQRLRATLVGRLHVACSEPAEVSLPGFGEPRPCPAEWIDVPIGDHLVGLTTEDGRATSGAVTVVGGETATLTLEPPPKPPPQPPPEPLPPPPPPPPERGKPVGPWLVGGAAAFAVGGGVLLYLATESDAERAAAEKTLRAATEVDPAAEARFDDAADATTAYGIGGWSALAIGAGLGAVGGWLVLDPTAADRVPRLAPDGTVLDPSPGDAFGWTLTAGALAFAAGGGALLYLSTEAASERTAAGDTYRAATSANDDPAADEARRAFHRADGQVIGYTIAGWSAIGLGAGLGALATWHWLGPTEMTAEGRIEARVFFAPGHVGLAGRF